MFAPTRRLAPGAEVAVIAPSGPVEEAALESGLAVLASRYRPTWLGPSQRWRYFSGPDDLRAAALHEAVTSTRYEAVFVARGGYGSTRLLPTLHGALPQRPKPVVGFSDVTAIHCFLQIHGWRSLHAPGASQLGKAIGVDRLFAALEGEPLPPLTAERAIAPGVAEGPLLGGNIALLGSLIGTPYLPSFAGAVLLIEDVGERPYRIDRLMTQLVQSGALAGLAGVAVGELTGCEERGAEYTAQEVLDDLVRALRVPAIGGLPIGHGERNEPVPLGARVRLDANTQTLSFLEGLVA